MKSFQSSPIISSVIISMAVSAKSSSAAPSSAPEVGIVGVVREITRPQRICREIRGCSVRVHVEPIAHLGIVHGGVKSLRRKRHWASWY